MKEMKKERAKIKAALKEFLEEENKKEEFTGSGSGRSNCIEHKSEANEEQDDDFWSTFKPQMGTDEEDRLESGVESDNESSSEEEASWNDILGLIGECDKSKPTQSESPTTLMCPSFSKLHFVRRYQPPWLEFVNYIEPADLPMIRNTQTQIPGPPQTALDFDTWRRYAESVDPARRESAVNALAHIVHLIKSDSWTLFFEQLERLMGDDEKSADVIKTAYKHLIEVAQFLKTIGNEHFEEFNMRIPGQLIRMLVSEREECKKAALLVIERFVNEKLLNIKVIQNMVVPGLLFYLSAANDKLHRYERMMTRQMREEQRRNQRFFSNSDENEDNEEPVNERDCQDTDGIIGGIFCILANILSQTTTNNEGGIDHFLTQFIDYVADPHQIPILKSQDSIQIREILARCLAPLAKLIGTDGADSKLLPIFQRFMRDSPEIQCAALEQLADFCSILSQESRELLLPDLSQLVTLDGDTRSWRQRAEFAEQLTKMVFLFSTDLVNLYICPFALAFSTDRIAEVRNNGIGMLATVLAAFVKEEWAFGSASMALSERLVDEIRTGFLNTRDWRRKQSFGRLIYLLIARNLLDENQFCHLFSTDLITLSKDSIPNVRQYFCLLAQINQFSNKPIGQIINTRLEEMAADDKDLEIRNLAKIALGIVDPEKMGLDLDGRTERLA